MLFADPGDNLPLTWKISDDSLIDVKMLGEALHICLNSANSLHESESSLQRMYLTCLSQWMVCLDFLWVLGFFLLARNRPSSGSNIFFSSD